MKRGVIVALDLEDDGVAVADVDDPGIFSGSADHPRAGGRQPLEPDLRRFVRAVLAPHDREDAELGHVRRPAEDRDGALELLRRQPSVLQSRQRRRDVARHHFSLRGPATSSSPQATLRATTLDDHSRSRFRTTYSGSRSAAPVVSVSLFSHRMPISTIRWRWAPRANPGLSRFVDGFRSGRSDHRRQAGTVTIRVIMAAGLASGAWCLVKFSPIRGRQA